MLTYTGKRPFQLRDDSEVIEPDDTIPKAHPDYEYFRTRGDFASTATTQPSAVSTLSPSAAPRKKPKQPKRRSRR